MTFHVRLLTPHVTPRPQKLRELAGLDAVLPVTFSHVGLREGPASIESAFDDALAAPGVVAAALEAEAEGADAVIIDCMGDPGLDAAREAVNIPVLGPGEASMHAAAMLGHSFSVVTILDRVAPILRNHARIYGVAEKLASIRAIDVPVLEIEDNEQAIRRALLDEARKAIRHDKADVIVLGCTGFLGLSRELSDSLKAEGLPAPVVNPLRTTAMMALALLGAGLSHSAIAYPPPRAKPIRGFSLPEVTKS